MFKAIFIALVSLLLWVGPSDARTQIASWNVLHLGTNKSKDYEALGRVAGHFDLIALQEVMTIEGLDLMLEAVRAQTGAPWEATWSHAVGRGSYREKYAFIWRTDRITHLGGDLVYIDDRDVFAREPFSAAFKTYDGFEFVIGNIHAIYGETVADRQKEARALRGYFDYLVETFPDLPIILAGDFNLTPANPAWRDIYQVATPLIQEGGTTLSARNGVFANLYDNIFMQSNKDLPVLGAGRLEFPSRVLGITHEEARRHVSDHIPVFVIIDTNVSTRFAPMDMVNPDLPAVIGNRNSGIYHLSHCPGYTATAKRNRVAFDSSEQASAAGFRRARNCS